MNNIQIMINGELKNWYEVDPENAKRYDELRKIKRHIHKQEKSIVELQELLIEQTRENNN